MTELLLLANWSDLLAARLQMAFTLGSHIILACFGVGLPLLMLVAEGLSLKGDTVWLELARRWSKSFAVLFAVGAVSGTVLSFELGLLWPEFMGMWGSVIGLPFTLEGFAFFVEAIFAGIYLYGWNRLPPKVHWLTGIPIAMSGFMSAWFVVTANAWMNSPQGFEMVNGNIVMADPVHAMLNQATWAQTTHMILAAYMVSGFAVASFYGWRRLRGDQSLYVRRAIRLGLALGCVATPLQVWSGDWSAKVVARTQPVKFAAMEATFETQRGAPLHLGGLPDEEAGKVRFSLEIPRALSFLAFSDFDAVITGLNDFPVEDRPPVAIVHVAFQVMVGIGSGLLLLSGWTVYRSVHKRLFQKDRWFLITLVASGPLTVLAMEAGWVVTEVGRQPWIVQGYMRTADAVTGASGLWAVFVITISIYAVLMFGLIFALRYLANLPREQHGS